MPPLKWPKNPCTSWQLAFHKNLIGSLISVLTVDEGVNGFTMIGVGNVWCA